MSTTLSSLGPLPNDVQIQEDLLTGDIAVVVRGRDELHKTVISRSAYYDMRELVIREVVQNARLYLRRREQRIDAITAKLMS